jgi:hypothetical protein
MLLVLLVTDRWQNHVVAALQDICSNSSKVHVYPADGCRQLTLRLPGEVVSA